MIIRENSYDFIENVEKLDKDECVVFRALLEKSYRLTNNVLTLERNGFSQAFKIDVLNETTLILRLDDDKETYTRR